MPDRTDPYAALGSLPARRWRNAQRAAALDPAMTAPVSRAALDALVADIDAGGQRLAELAAATGHHPDTTRALLATAPDPSVALRALLRPARIRRAG